MIINWFLLQTSQNTQSVKDAAEKIAQNSEKFKVLDPIGIGMTVIGMAVVFLSLILLYLLFLNISKLLNKSIEKKKSKIVSSATSEEKHIKYKDGFQGQAIAAISYALHQHFEEIHDNENLVLTINKVSRTYSPWSSKIYGLRQTPR